MSKTRLCLNTSELLGISVEEQIKLFAKVGFDGFFTAYENYDAIKRYKAVADSEGMLYQSVHAPMHAVDKMWENGIEGERMTELLKECVNACADNNISIMVSHMFITFGKHNPTKIGLKSFEKVVLEAEKRNIKVAFENAEGDEYNDAVLTHFKGCDTVGFCWDTGHEMCYNHRDLMDEYGDMLIATHLNDNLGTQSVDGKIAAADDLHLFPFDGIGDWERIVDFLNKYDYNGELTFEVKAKRKHGRRENDIYAELSAESFVTEAYKRACRVAELKLKGYNKTK